MHIFCTLFDSKYIDKGIALYESLETVDSDFKLYVFAFDQIAYDILCDLKFKKMQVISLAEFETERMLEVKKERSAAEYCWTCTPITLDYVLRVFNESECTYLDADLYFFGSPGSLLEEIKSTGDSVIITEHRFSPELKAKLLPESGKYCVQFNTFLNNQEGQRVLQIWKSQCLDWCFYAKNGEKKGDQKYLENWVSTYEGVHELQHLGGGVAPWNLSQYSLKDSKDLILSFNGYDFPLVFYHFQNIRYLPFGLINLKSGTSDRLLKVRIYFPYLQHIEKIREMLQKEYGHTFSIKKAYYSNPLLKFIQNYVMPFKINVLSDIVSKKTIRKYNGSTN